MAVTEHETDYDGAEGDDVETPTMSAGVGGIIPRHRRRAVYAVLGIALFIGAIGTFRLASDAFDDRTPVVVALAAVEEGATFAAGDLGRAEALVDGIAHMPWTPGIEESLTGFIATANVEPGTLIYEGLFAEPDPLAAPTNSIEIQLRVAPHGSSAPLTPEETALLIAEGTKPALTEGQPRRIVGPPVQLRHFEAGILRLYPTPATWYETWTTYITAGPLQALVVDPDHAEEIATALSDGWLAEWEANKVVAGFAAPGSGDLDMVLPLDASLTEGPIRNGDTVLIIAGGSDALAEDAQPPRVLEHRFLDGWNATDSSLRLFGLTPTDWVYYRSLLHGPPPLVLKVSDHIEWTPQVPCDTCETGVRTGRFLDRLITGMVQDWEQRRHNLPQGFFDFDRLARDNAEGTQEGN